MTVQSAQRTTLTKQIESAITLTERLCAGQPINQVYYFRLCTQLGLQLKGSSQERTNSNIYLWSGNCHKNGIGTKRNEATAIVQYTKGAALGNLECMIQLAILHDPDTHVPTLENNNVFFHWCTLAVNQYEIEAPTYSEDLRKIYSYLYTWFGNCYYIGFGTAVNIETAKFWFEKGAALGNFSCKNNLADIYNTERSTNPSLENKAAFFKWCSQAAEQLEHHQDLEMEYSYLYNWLGDCYNNGSGTAVNIETAKYWFEKGAALGNLSCKINLAILFSKERQINSSPENNAGCFEWCAQAISQLEFEGRRDPKEQYSFLYNWLATCFKSAIGTEQNMSAATYWYERGAELGNSICMIRLAGFYRNKIYPNEAIPQIKPPLREQDQQLIQANSHPDLKMEYQFPDDREELLRRAFNWCFKAADQLDKTEQLKAKYSHIYWWLSQYYASPNFLEDETTVYDPVKAVDYSNRARTAGYNFKAGEA